MDIYPKTHLLFGSKSEIECVLLVSAHSDREILCTGKQPETKNTDQVHVCKANDILNKLGKHSILIRAKVGISVKHTVLGLLVKQCLGNLEFQQMNHQVTVLIYNKPVNLFKVYFFILLYFQKDLLIIIYNQFEIEMGGEVEVD